MEISSRHTETFFFQKLNALNQLLHGRLFCASLGASGSRAACKIASTPHWHLYALHALVNEILNQCTPQHISKIEQYATIRIGTNKVDRWPCWR